jgi:hypothetical protein
MRPFSHLDIAHTFWQMTVKPGDTVIDATAGNGHDSLFLALLAIKDGAGKLIAFDIQKQAIDNTRERLKDFADSQIFIHQMCHSMMSQVVEAKSAKLIAFNLGYLPGADKTCTTMRNSSVAAIQASLEVLQSDGLLSITCYPGHEEGFYEEQKVLEFLLTLDPKLWSITSHTFLSRPKHPHLILVKPINI